MYKWKKGRSDCLERKGVTDREEVGEVITLFMTKM